MTSPLGIATSIFGGALFGSLFGGDKKETAAPAAAAPSDTPPPDQSTPAIAPGSKPAPKKSQQASFLSGAAGLQSAGAVGANTGSSGGKSLLGQ